MGPWSSWCIGACSSTTTAARVRQWDSGGSGACLIGAPQHRPTPTLTPHTGVLNEPGIDGKGLIIRGRHWLLLAPAALAPPLYKAMQHEALALPTTARAFAALGTLTLAQWLQSYSPSAALLAAPLPPNVHLATAQAWNATAVLVRLAHT